MESRESAARETALRIASSLMIMMGDRVADVTDDEGNDDGLPRPLRVRTEVGTDRTDAMVDPRGRAAYADEVADWIPVAVTGNLDSPDLASTDRGRIARAIDIRVTGVCLTPDGKARVSAWGSYDPLAAVDN